MKANELRIGNLIQSRDNREFEVTLEDLQFIEAGSLCKPILLTEEWLLKFGFKKSDNDLFELIVIRNEEIQYDIWFRTESGLYANIESFQVVTEEQTNLPFLHIKHVHQLQNLYFALTNEELTIKQ